jgi:hypothetical protein
MIDEDRSQIPIWFVWCIFEKSHESRELVAVALTNTIANVFRKTMQHDPRVIKCWVEPREANHLYGAGMVAILTDEEIRRQVASMSDGYRRDAEQARVELKMVQDSWGRRKNA